MKYSSFRKRKTKRSNRIQKLWTILCYITNGWCGWTCVSLGADTQVFFACPSRVLLGGTPHLMRALRGGTKIALLPEFIWFIIFFPFRRTFCSAAGIFIQPWWKGYNVNVRAHFHSFDLSGIGVNCADNRTNTIRNFYIRCLH